MAESVNAEALDLVLTLYWCVLVLLQQLLRLLSTFGSIYQKMCMYMCREALYMLEQLPASQLASGWVQHQIGRAHFEMADYNSVRKWLFII